MYYNINMKKTTDLQKTKRVRRNRKEEILETASKLFAEYGYQGTSFASIAEKVGLTEQGVLHYFPNKENLLQGVLQYRDDEAFNRYSKFFDLTNKNIDVFFDLLVEAFSENEKVPGLIQLFTVLVGESIRSDHLLHDYFVERYRQVRELYIQNFINMNLKKLRPDIDEGQLASVIMAVMDGLQIQWLLDPEKVNLVESFRFFSKMIVDYLKQ